VLNQQHVTLIKFVSDFFKQTLANDKYVEKNIDKYVEKNIDNQLIVKTTKGAKCCLEKYGLKNVCLNYSDWLEE
jgi:hypothetical protein